VKLLIVRHAKSMDRNDFTGSDDWDRPISDVGRREMKENADGIKSLVPGVDTFVSSPLRRALQTADIVIERYGVSTDPVKTETLAPEADPSDFHNWLKECDLDGTTAIFGHRPSLPRIVSYLLSGRKNAFVELKKGSALLLEIDSSMSESASELQWAMTPEQLRRFA
jgi:phosphohistidine phosphatase